MGDLNGDTVNDLVVANNNSATLSVLYGKSGGGYDTPVTFPVGTGPSSVAMPRTMPGTTRARRTP